MSIELFNGSAVLTTGQPFSAEGRSLLGQFRIHFVQRIVAFNSLRTFMGRGTSGRHSHEDRGKEIKGTQGEQKRPQRTRPVGWDYF